MLLTAEFSTTEPVTEAIAALSAAGIASDDIELFSDRPIELPAGMLERRSGMSLIAVLGGVVNGGLATAFMFFTQRNYPLITGGMPITSGWSTGVVSYEMTMAGAVAGVTLAFLWEGRLLFRARRSTPPPALREGSTLLRVQCEEERAPAAIRCLRQAGAIEVLEQ